LILLIITVIVSSLSRA